MKLLQLFLIMSFVTINVAHLHASEEKSPSSTYSGSPHSLSSGSNSSTPKNPSKKETNAELLQRCKNEREQRRLQREQAKNQAASSSSAAISQQEPAASQESSQQPTTQNLAENHGNQAPEDNQEETARQQAENLAAQRNELVQQRIDEFHLLYPNRETYRKNINEKADTLYEDKNITTKELKKIIAALTEKDNLSMPVHQQETLAAFTKALERKQADAAQSTEQNKKVRRNVQFDLTDFDDNDTTQDTKNDTSDNHVTISDEEDAMITELWNQRIAQWSARATALRNKIVGLLPSTSQPKN